MQNRIVSVEVRNHQLSPAASEVHIAVRPALRTPHTELRGRWMGPSCVYASTVEIAYPLRPMSLDGETEHLLARVVIPEPSLWDLQSPFLYGGPVELWEEGQRVDVVQVRHGLRRLHVGAQSVSINGRPVTLRCKAMTRVCSEDEARQLHDAGYNAIVAPQSGASTPYWDIGDRYGFLVFGRVETSDSGPLHVLEALGAHPSCAGWLISDPALDLPGAIPPGVAQLVDAAD